MKYLSLIAVVILLVLTWSFFQQDKTLTVSQQNRLLNAVKGYMTQAVKAKDPDAREIQFSNLYTETVEPGRTLKAHFKFSYLQNLGGSENRVYRKGHFLVTSKDGRQWQAKIDEIGDVQVEFLEPQDIAPAPGEAPAPDELESTGETHDDH